MYWQHMRLLGLTTLLIALEECEGITSVITTPLIVKSPYFQSWINQTNMNTTNSTWPSFWNGKILQWSSRIQVDDTTYQWMGLSSSSNLTVHRPHFTASNITPTRTIFTFEAGSVGFNATFLSPINPSDLVRQSLPFGYIYVDVWSLDGLPHSIQIYFDTSGEILSNNLDEVMQWNTTSTGSIVYHHMALSNSEPFVEDGDIANDATFYLAMGNHQNMSWEIGLAGDLRFSPKANSTAPLSNGSDISNSRPIQNGFPVLAFKADLGRITQTNESVVWAMGLLRDPVIQDTSFGSMQLRRSYYWSAYVSVDDIIQDVIEKFDDVKSDSVNLDNRIMTDGAAIFNNDALAITFQDLDGDRMSSYYVDLLSLSLRLVFGAMDITVGSFPNGTVDKSDVKIFVKDLGTSKQVQVFFYSAQWLTLSSRVNPVEILYASLPAILYLNSSLASLILEPLLEYQNSSSYTNIYAAPDLGQAYPNVTGNPTFNRQLAIESCSSMLIMTFAHASKSGDGALLNRYYDLLNQWAEYLEQSDIGTSTDGFETSDGDSGPYLSNLVLKGILGIYAMSRISEAAGRSGDSSQHLSRAQNYTSKWKQLALSSGHITSVSANTTSTWGLTYNLHAAKLLSATTLIEDAVYTQQSEFYASQILAAQPLALAYDENGPSAKSHWTVFTAAAMPDTSVRDSLIDMIPVNLINDNDHAPPFPSTYDISTRKVISGTASPGQGAMFALLALNLTDRQISGFSSTPLTSESTRSAKNIGRIAGGTIGGVIGLCLVILSVFVLFKRGIRLDHDNSSENTVIAPFQVPQTTPSVFTSWARTLPIMSKSPRKMDISDTPSQEGHTPTAEISQTVPATSNGPSVDILMEVERLRREVDEIRNERIHETEPPPLYDLGNRSSSSTLDHAAAPPAA